MTKVGNIEREKYEAKEWMDIETER
jgi:hypothetical protein